MSTAQVRPSRIWFGVGGAVAILAVAGAILWIVLGVKGLVDRTDELQRVPLPGVGQVTFDEPGDYTLYVEVPGAGNSDIDLPQGEVVMEPVEGGNPIEFQEYDGSFTYDWGGHEGRAVLTFTITQPGTYRVSTETESGLDEGEVALGESLVGDLPRTIALALVMAFVLLAAAAAIITVTAVKRHRARKADLPPGSPKPTPFGQYQPYQPYPPQYPQVPPPPQYPQAPPPPHQYPQPPPS